jgi:sorbitol/mannitol transport system substrate-binding protein
MLTLAFGRNSMKLNTLFLGLCGASALAFAAHAETITIATVNNGDMVRMQKLTDDFTAKNPDIQLEWVTLEENVLRERVTTDIATKGGQYRCDDHRHLRGSDLGQAAVALAARQPWRRLRRRRHHPGKIAGGLSADGKLYAAPFYGESSFVMYRKDLMEKAGLTMPDAPTWDFIADAARKMTDRAADINGICLRGKAGWGENMAFLTAMSNSFGARWFDEKWQPQFDQPEWKKTLQFYVDLMKDAGPSGASSNGFNENLALFQQGKCGMWIDATVAASFVSNPKDSTVADKVGYALAPDTGLGKRGNWLWAWSLGDPRPARRRPRRRRSSSHGRPARTISTSSPRRKAGPTFRPARAPRSTRTPSTRRPRPSPR